MTDKKINITETMDKNFWLEVGAREAIENHLFKIALEHAELASKDVDREDVPKMQTEMKHSIIAIVMSFTALEALSNDLYKSITRHDFESDDFEKFPKDPIKKWKNLAKRAFELKNPNEKLSLPHNFTKTLREIKTLRNFIIHYKPKLENTRNLRRTSKDHVASHELEIFNSENAAKAIQTVRTLLETFEKITGYKVPKLE